MTANGENPPPPTPAAAGGGDLQPPLSLEVFVRTQGSSVLAFIHRIFPAALRSRYDPIDLFQTTMFEAFRRLDTFRPISDAATLSWLFVLARRQVGMALRRERRDKRGGLLDEDHAGHPRRLGTALNDSQALHLLEAYAVYRRTPSQSAIRHEAVLAVDRALDELPAHLGEAVRLRHIEGLSPEQVAKALGKTERAAATLCYRGLRLLRRKLQSMPL
jgi:RNA polymerase sigma factor (sigma-70 family)